MTSSASTPLPFDLISYLSSTGSGNGTGIAFLDRDARILFASDGAAVVCGLPPGNHVGRRLSDLWPDAWQRMADRFARVLSGEPVDFDVSIAHPSDSRGTRTCHVYWSPVTSGGEVVGVAASVMDVTDVRETTARERELTARQATLRLIANAALSDAPAEVVFDAALAALQRHLRLPLVRAMRIAPGSGQLNIFVEAGWDASIMRANPIGPRSGSFADYVLTHPVTVEFNDLPSEHRFRRPAVFLAHGVRSGLGVRISAGQRVWGHLGAYDRRTRHFDCDEIAFIEEVAAILGLMVQERDSRAFREEVLSMASHQMRTPLTSVIGLAQHLQRRVARGRMESIPELLDLLVAEAFRLNEVLDRWNELAAAESYHEAFASDPVDVCEVVAGRVEQFRSRYPEMHVVERYPDSPATVASDGERIGEIVDNLLENGRKHGGGEIEMITERVDGGVALHCLDHGSGVPPESAPFIFDRFFRGASTAEHAGMGLGLYISRMLAEGLDGTLDVTSLPGEGARFT
ncbi:MAG: ATP-binding protein, partial [Chloroflexi bacterium]|nr:ATP-binding protein [Chloroflexota bacterium]